MRLSRRWIGRAPGGWVGGGRSLRGGVLRAGDADETQYLSNDTNNGPHIYPLSFAGYAMLNE
jgi:hypothetical protein